MLIDVGYITLMLAYALLSAMGYDFSAFAVAIAVPAVVSLVYGSLRSLHGGLNRYLRLSALVFASLALPAAADLVLRVRRDPLQNAEWTFGAVTIVYIAVAGWLAFSIGYGVTLLATRKV